MKTFSMSGTGTVLGRQSKKILPGEPQNILLTFEDQWKMGCSGQKVTVTMTSGRSMIRRY